MTVIARQAWQSALLVGGLLLCVYVGTAAPSLTFWDASEFATAIGTFGIPHPPGTPLYVALGSTLWHLLPVVTPVQAGTLLSAASTAAACAVAAGLVVRISGRRAPGIVAGLAAGAMGTVWMNATETEVYAVALLSVALQFLVAWRAHVRDDDRARVLLAYIAALSIPLHLSALVATPAAMLLAHTDVRGAIRWRALSAAGLLVLATVALSQRLVVVAVALAVGAVVTGRGVVPAGARATGAETAPLHGVALRAAGAVTLLGWSAMCIALVRARHAPFLNQGDPSTWEHLLDVVARVQYDVAAPWPRRAPLWLQLGNIIQYADWQVALAGWNDVTPSWWRTPFTVVAAALGAAGAMAHWRSHRVTARALGALFLLASLGVCLQLNLRAGPSFGYGVLPDTAIREARDRDYFYALAFWVWGLWIGCGAWALARRAKRPALWAALVPVLMLGGNWRAVSRNALPDRRIVTVMADDFLAEVPVRGMLFTAGDNDSYPLWYRQAVDSVRPDVQVVVISLLPATWYFRESLARAGLHAADTTGSAAGLDRAARLARGRLDQAQGIAVSLLVSAAERNELGRLAGVTCWSRAGLVDIGSRASHCPARVDVDRSAASAKRLGSLHSVEPRQSTDGMVAAFLKVARCPGAAAEAAISGAASADSAAQRLLDITCNLR